MKKTFKWGGKDYTVEAMKWGAAKRFWELVLTPNAGNAYETLEEMLDMMNCPKEVLADLDNLYDDDVQELLRVLRVTHFPNTEGAGGNPPGGGSTN